MENQTMLKSTLSALQYGLNKMILLIIVDYCWCFGYVKHDCWSTLDEVFMLLWRKLPTFFSFLSFVSVVIAESMQQCVRGNHNLSQFMKKNTEQKNVVQSTSVSAELYE